MGEARAVGGRLAGLPALLHCVEADPSIAPRVDAAGVPAVTLTQSNRPCGSRRRRGRRGERWQRGRRRRVTGAVAAGAVPVVCAGQVGAGIRSSIGGPSSIAAAGCTITQRVVLDACTAYFRQGTPRRHGFRDQRFARLQTTASSWRLGRWNHEAAWSRPWLLPAPRLLPHCRQRRVRSGRSGGSAAKAWSVIHGNAVQPRYARLSAAALCGILWRLFHSW